MATVRKAIKNIATGKGAQKLKPPAHSETDGLAEIDFVSLPNAIPTQYPPLILVHVLLLSAALVLLPQTPLPDLPLPPPPRGLDKPQYPFLIPITARPVLTLAWACLGATLLVPWWAGSLRSWVHDGTLGPRSMQLRLQGDPHKRRVRPLSASTLTLPPHPFLSFPNPTYLSTHVGYLECMCLHMLYRPCAARSHHLVRSAIRPVRLCPTRFSAHIPLIILPPPGMCRTPHSYHCSSLSTPSSHPHTRLVHRVLGYRFSPRPPITPSCRTTSGYGYSPSASKSLSCFPEFVPKCNRYSTGRGSLLSGACSILLMEHFSERGSA